METVATSGIESQGFNSGILREKLESINIGVSMQSGAHGKM